MSEWVQYEYVNVSESDRQWIREYLGQDAATNSEHVQDCKYWLVGEHEGGDVVIFPVNTSDVTPEGMDEGFEYDGTISECVRELRDNGFPRDQYV